MIRVAVVEDEKDSLDHVLNCLKRFEEEEGVAFLTTVFRYFTDDLTDVKTGSIMG